MLGVERIKDEKLKVPRDVSAVRSARVRSQETSGSERRTGRRETFWREIEKTADGSQFSERTDEKTTNSSPRRLRCAERAGPLAGDERIRTDW